MSESDLLYLIESLQKKIHDLGEKAQKAEQKDRAHYAEKFLESLSRCVERKDAVFGIEPWHALEGDHALTPGEMLLRVKDSNGALLPPYPAVMTFYHNGFITDLDVILVLCALYQFRQGDERQVSINISGRSLLDATFIKSVLQRLEEMKITSDEKILFEIHESNAAAKINPKTLAMLRKFNIGFAIDDVGLSMNDVFRLSSFENIAEYIKLDRSSIGANPESPKSLAHVLAMAKVLLPEATMVAEGIKSADHAREILKLHPGIRYVQGMDLPDRATFAKDWGGATEKPAK